MSQATKNKKRFNWESNVPRCDTCRYVRHPVVVLTVNSNTRVTGNYCALGEFQTRPMACCDQWHGKNGDTLDIPAPAPANHASVPDNPNQCRVCHRLFGTAVGVLHHFRDVHAPKKGKA